MTKERRLAIKMWKDIRDMLTSYDEWSYSNVVAYKRSFCARHDLNWVNDCWFCQYMPSCSKCPLVRCGIDSSYEIVKADYVEKNIRIEACNSIIAALGGEA